jgi:hypothetical protein
MNAFEKYVYSVTLVSYSYVTDRLKPWHSPNECSSANVGSHACQLWYVELNQLGANIMKMHASPAAWSREAGWLLAATNMETLRHCHIETCIYRERSGCLYHSLSLSRFLPCLFPLTRIHFFLALYHVSGSSLEVFTVSAGWLLTLSLRLRTYCRSI